MKRIITSLLITFASLSFTAGAVESSPYKTLEHVGKNLFTRIANNQEELKKFPSLMETIVAEELMPHIDYQYSAYRILGKNLKKTTKEQREMFSNSMKHYLIRTYASALKQYHNQQVTFERDKPVKGKRIVSVNTQILEMGKPTIEITFQMRQNKKTKEWKAYDMVVEGISLLNTKKAELNSKITKLGVEQVSLELAYIQK